MSDIGHVRLHNDIYESLLMTTDSAACLEATVVSHSKTLGLLLLCSMKMHASYGLNAHSLSAGESQPLTKSHKLRTFLELPMSLTQGLLQSIMHLLDVLGLLHDSLHLPLLAHNRGLQLGICALPGPALLVQLLAAVLCCLSLLLLCMQKNSTYRNLLHHQGYSNLSVTAKIFPYEGLHSAGCGLLFLEESIWEIQGVESTCSASSGFHQSLFTGDLMCLLV